MFVIKRNGSKEEFNPKKIENAILKAFAAQNYSVADWEKKYIEAFCDRLKRDNNLTSVENIQDSVERFLMSQPTLPHWQEVAKAYILYRERHNESRFVRSRIDYIDAYSSSGDNASTASETDANANVSMKNVANLEGEVYKKSNRVIQRQRMKDKLKELFPEVAKQYERDLENHIIYVHDEASSPVPKKYCLAASLYPLMTEGVGNIDSVTPTPPNDIQSFSGQVTNLTFLLSSQAKGAVALGEYIVALNYYVIAEFGPKWYEKLNVVITNENALKKYTVKSYIRKGMKQFIYGVSQPAGNRSYNSPFSNISYYDKTYFHALFDEFFYPDGTQPEWEAIDTLQRIFMELHRELRLIKPLTFPVTTMAMVHDGTDVIDKEYKELCAEEWAKGGSFFCYLSDNPSSLASCCFSKDTKVLWKNSYDGVKCSTFEELHNLKWEPYKKNMKVYHNGAWLPAKTIKLPNRKMYKVRTQNNKEFIMSDNHINLTFRGEVHTSELSTEDYLMFNTKPLEAVKECDEHLTYEQGLLVGMFIGDGTYGNYICEDGAVHDILLSLNEEKYNKALPYLTKLCEVRLHTPHNNVYPVRLYSKELVAFLMEWTGNKPKETYSYNKNLNINCVLQSKEFRKGILDGWYLTDGGNSNRCYTTSKNLVDSMEILLTSLGKQCVIDITDRTDETVAIRGEEYNRNYPLYCVRWYSDTNARVRPESGFKWKNNSIYWKISSIEEVEYTDDIYCFEMRNQDEPYFTLPSGLITHNCRVLNEITDNTFSSINGLQGIMTGSCNVITLNINRIVQDWARQKVKTVEDNNGILDSTINVPGLTGLKEYLISILERVYKYHIAYKTILYELEDKGMFADSNAGYIYLKKLYSTIGLIGYCEAAQFLQMKISNNEEYKDFLKLIFGTVKEQNKLHSIHDKKRPFLFNSEAIPGENLAVKLYEWDKKDGYTVPKDQNLYSSYFFLQWDKDIPVLDKLRLHGKYINSACDGGQACHIHLNEHLSKEQYSKIIDFCIKEGVNYFTFNIPVSECKDCGHVVNAPIKTCPKCGSDKIDWWIRIIGFLRPISTWAAPRQIESQKRVYSNGKTELKEL